ncbi:uncharacterized protein [Atheta coriaria]|uniref:uncharacterized protein n=1 Tax=Dalotia coriaria TaxID=877792 RepID=UPI0031F42516
MTRSIISALLLLVAVSSVHSLRCYSCDSSKGFACDYSILSFTFPSVECENSGGGILDAIASIFPMTCAKIAGTDSDGKTYTARGCVPKGTNLACHVIATTMKFADSKQLSNQVCETCDSDNCNSAGRVGGMTAAALLAACFLFLF